jgi:glutamate racemase
LKKQPIGIFDSGVGGLTVFKEIRKQFPYEDIVYFGDTARVPYGPKSKQTVVNYSIQNARFLNQLNAKMVVIACNTSSAVAIPALQTHFQIPVIGVILPGAKEAQKQTKSGRIGIIGTEGTIRSQAYEQELKKLNPAFQVFSKACPLFVSLAEEGWNHHPVTTMIAQEYLQELIEQDIDSLVLGCTHYPILKSVIQEVVGDSIQLIDSAIAISKELLSILPAPETKGIGKNRLFVSDNEGKFRKLAEMILEEEIDELVNVKLGESWYIER